MKRVAVLAMRRAHQAGFTIVHDHELAALDALPMWMTRLFMALLRVANHATGAGQITYASLMAKMEPLQPRSGPRHFVPTMQALKRAIDTLEARCLIRRDQLHSQATQALVFQVDPRYEKARSRRKQDPQTRPPASSENVNADNGLQQPSEGTRPPNSTPSSGMNSDHSKDGELSTDRDRARAVRAAVRAALGRRGAGGEASPQGG